MIFIHNEIMRARTNLDDGQENAQWLRTVYPAQQAPKFRYLWTEALCERARTATVENKAWTASVKEL